MAGSAREHAVRDRHLLDVARSIETVIPGLIQRMDRGSVWRDRKGFISPHGVLDPNQPEIHGALCRLSAKLALAEYYQSTRSPAPLGTHIKTLWTHYFDHRAREPVDWILKSFPAVRRLAAGRWNADRDFFMRVGELDGHQFTAAFFHESLVLAAQLFPGEAEPPGQKWMKVMGPRAEAGILELRQTPPSSHSPASE